MCVQKRDEPNQHICGSYCFPQVVRKIFQHMRSLTPCLATEGTRKPRALAKRENYSHIQGRVAFCIFVSSENKYLNLHSFHKTLTVTSLTSGNCCTIHSFQHRRRCSHTDSILSSCAVINLSFPLHGGNENTSLPFA